MIVRYNPEIHHRRSIRLKGYDYSQEGAYFVTICAQERKCMFGEVESGEMRLNEAGGMVERWWGELNHKFRELETCESVVMPNHFHGIMMIVRVGADLRVCPNSDTRPNQGAHTGAPLPKIVQWFKTMTTNEYIHHVKSDGWQPFTGKLWQRNFYEHIIRDEADYTRIAEYIATNPQRWMFDALHPDNADSAQGMGDNVAMSDDKKGVMIKGTANIGITARRGTACRAPTTKNTGGCHE